MPLSHNKAEQTKNSNHIKLILLMIFALLLVVFAIQNSNEVVIQLWFWKFRTSMALAFVICIVSGFLLSFLYSLTLLHNKNKIIRAKDKELTKLKNTSQTAENNESIE
ncbi:MAG: LapA family protein [Bacteroidales bacterium]